MNFCEYLADFARDALSGSGSGSGAGAGSGSGSGSGAGFGLDAEVYSNVDPAREWNGAATVEFNEPNDPQTRTFLSGGSEVTRDVYAIARAATQSEADSLKTVLRDICESAASRLLSENKIYAWAVDETGTTADARGIVEGESFYGYVRLILIERNGYGGQ